MDWTVKVTDLAIIFAMLIGPIAAVQAQKWVEGRREQRNRRQRIFHTLMGTRWTTLFADHVNALNAIPLEFAGRCEGLSDVRSAWRVYIHHLNASGDMNDAWLTRRVDLCWNCSARLALP